jgi:hypothetical protein
MRGTAPVDDGFVDMRCVAIDQVKTADDYGLSPVTNIFHIRSFGNENRIAIRCRVDRRLNRWKALRNAMADSLDGGPRRGAQR